jgi:cell division protein FtsQ
LTGGSDPPQIPPARGGAPAPHGPQGDPVGRATLDPDGIRPDAPAPGAAPGQAPGQVRGRWRQRHALSRSLAPATADDGGGAGGGGNGGSGRGSRWRAIFFGLAGVGIVAGLAWALLGSRFFVVRSVEVTGTQVVPASAVIAAADVPDGTPLLRVDVGAVQRRVESIRDVASATVSKAWPDKLVIVVRERTPVVAVRMSRGYDLMDASGVIVRWSSGKPAALPQYLTSLPGNGLRGNPDLAAAASVLASLPSWLSGSVAEVSASAPGQVALRLRDRVTIVWGSDSRNEQKSEELRILMRQTRASYYDVSAEGTVVTK